MFSLKFKPVQTWAAKKTAAYLSEKLHTDIGLKSLYIVPFSKVVLDGFFIKDLDKDTLLKTSSLKVDITDFSLFAFNGITLKNIEIDGGKAFIKTYKDSTTNYNFILDYFSTPRDTSKISKPFNLVLNDVKLNDMELRYVNYLNIDHNIKGINFDDIFIKHLTTNIKNIDIKNHIFQGQINHLSLVEKSGFILNDLTAKTTIDSNQIVFENLRLTTPNTQLTNYFSMKFKNFSDFNDLSNKVILEGHFKDTKVYAKDIGFFVPDLAANNLSFVLSGEVKGNVSDLRAKDLLVKTGKATYLRGNFHLKGLPDIKNTFMELDLAQAFTNKTDIEYIIQQATGKRPKNIPAILGKFGNINFKGTFTGLVNDFVAYGDFKTRLGQLKSDVNMKISPSGNAVYSGKLNAIDFDLGELLNQPMLNRTSFVANISGKNFDINALSEKVLAKATYFDFNGYRYRNIDINGIIKQQVFNGKLKINDKNIKLNFDGIANLNPNLPEFNFTATIEGANLRQLNFSKDTVQIDAILNSRFSGNSLDNIQGDFSIRKIRLTDNEKSIVMDSIYLLADGIGKNRSLALTSDIGDASIKGEYDLKTLPSAFKTIVKKYIPSYQASILPPKNQNFEFKIDLKNFDYISSIFIPELKIPERGAFNGKFDTKNNVATLNGFVKTLTYKGATFNNIILDENTSDKALEAIISMDKVELSDGGIYVKNIIIQNTLKNDSLSFNIKLSDKDATNQLDLYGLVEFGTDTLAKVSLLPSDIIIDNKVWKLQDQVSLKFENKKTIIENFELSNNQQLIAINGAISSSENDGLEVVIQNLEMTSLSQLTKGFGVNLTGRMNGTASLSAILGTPNIKSDFTIDSLNYNETEIGQLKIASTYNNLTQKIDVDAMIFKNDLKTMDIKGNVDIKSETNNLNLNLILDRTELIIFEPFVKTLVSNLKGQVSSNLKLTGIFSQPKINGDLSLVNAGMTVNYLKTAYTINDKVTIDNSIIKINNLRIKDELGNLATANGNVNLVNPNNPDINITIDADNFMALNTTGKDNPLYYGKAFATGRFRFNGPTDAMNINIKAKTEAGTVFTIPLNGAATVSSNDFIIYVAKDTTLNKKPENFFKGLTMEFDLTVDENSTANILTEVGNLSGKGNAVLNLKITSLGDFEMKGDYSITEGIFNFTANNIINKTFDISKGGTIRWTGDPANGDINLNAIYATRAIIEPLYSAAGKILSDDRKAERVLVNAEMILKGSLLNPEINFGLEFPNNSRIKTELQGYLDDKDNEAQQVINLVVRNSFNGNSSSGIGLDANTIQGSVIELGVSKLNNIISQSLNIKNLDFNLRSLNELGFNYNFLNNRLKLSTNFVNNQYSNNLLSDNLFTSGFSNVSLDGQVSYDINKDGSFVGKLFQRPANKDIFNIGTDVIINGFGLVYTQEYDTFNEFIQKTFGRSKAKKEEKKDIPQEQKPSPVVIPEEKKSN